MVKVGKLRGDKVKYPDGVGCCVWYPFPSDDEDEDEGTGVCFDFPEEDIDDLILLLQKLKDTEAEVFEDEEKGESND